MPRTELPRPQASKSPGQRRRNQSRRGSRIKNQEGLPMPREEHASWGHGSDRTQNGPWVDKRGPSLLTGMIIRRDGEQDDMEMRGK